MTPRRIHSCVFFTQTATLLDRRAVLTASPFPFRDEQMLNLTNVKNVLFGDGVLEDIHNVDRFLGVSTAGYHFSRLTCRKTLDAVAEDPELPFAREKSERDTAGEALPPPRVCLRVLGIAARLYKRTILRNVM